MDWVYMLECGDGSLYTGWTNDLARRLAAHQSGRGAKYTRGRAPVRLVYAEQCTDKSAALRREAAVAGAQAGASAAMGNGGKSKGCCDGFTGSAQAYGGRSALSAGG